MKVKPYYKTSKITQRKYDIFSVARVFNLQQSMKYIENNVFPVDIEIVSDDSNNMKYFCFLFDKEESKEVYDKWCNYELK